MLTVELVSDRETKECFPKSLGIGELLTERFNRDGLLLEASNQMISFYPPLCITRSEVDEIVAGVSVALAETASELSLS